MEFVFREENTVRLSRLTKLTIFTIAGAACLSGCAGTPTSANSEEPTPKTIHLPDPNKVVPGRPATIDQTMEKSLFELRLSAAGINVNGTKVADIEALRALLEKYPDPAITIASHRCFSGERAAKIISLAQDYTTSPIAIGSFGDYSDPECQ